MLLRHAAAHTTSLRPLSTFTPALLHKAAARLGMARHKGGSSQNAEIEPELQQLLPSLTVAQAYELQAELVRMAASPEEYALTAMSGPGELVGWKVGATAAPPQKALGLESPFCSPLFGRWAVVAGQYEWRMNARGLGMRGVTIETELGFTVDSDLPPRDAVYSREEVVAALGELMPCIEVTGSRVAKPEGAAAAGPYVIADFGGCGAVAAGSRRVPKEEWSQLDLAATAVTLSRSRGGGAEGAGAVVAEGVGSAVMGEGGPLESATWLANELSSGAASVHERGLRKGDFVITGTLSGKTPAGDDGRAESFAADFGALGHVKLAFGEKELYNREAADAWSAGS